MTIIDRRETISADFQRGEGEISRITGTTLHVLADGRRFDLNVWQVTMVVG